MNNDQFCSFLSRKAERELSPNNLADFEKLTRLKEEAATFGLPATDLMLVSIEGHLRAASVWNSQAHKILNSSMGCSQETLLFVPLFFISFYFIFHQTL